MSGNPFTSFCPGCGRALFTRVASIPESIICYKAGTTDSSVSGNRIVEEMLCPVGGVIYSPGGGICFPGWENNLKCYERKT